MMNVIPVSVAAGLAKKQTEPPVLQAANAVQDIV